VRKGRDNSRDQNILDYVITPDLPDYMPARNGGGAVVTAPTPRSSARELHDEIPF
jgi:hypothetical protein